ncbi:MAG: ATP-binding protein [Blastocatellia bacterium]|nr:ATP-binding protein [Blastocatellia bacterium]
MRIKNFQYYDKAFDWKLERTTFSDLTLLVGISGVGKTQILDAIWRVREIAGGRPSNGAQWDITFSTNGHEYRWRGEYENKSVSEEEASPLSEPVYSKNTPRIVEEKLTFDDQEIVQRNESEIILRGGKTPKLSPFESVLDILNQEEDIAPAYKGFKRIIRSDFSYYRSRMFSRDVIEFNEMLTYPLTLEEIQESNVDSRIKIRLVSYCAPDIFDKIKERFMDIFPQVEDIRFEPAEGGIFPSFADYPLLQIKEKGVEGWIPQERISSGMYKTFMHLSEMFLWPEGTVVLIDEFENSLGVNCIDVLTEDLLQENRGLQFIITSHHPYIINNISPEYWKIVTRRGGVVSTHDAKDLHISDSRHKAFIQLINLEEYKEGIGVS